MAISTGDTVILDPTATHIAATLHVTGEDQDPTTGRWFVSARNNPGGPVLGIADSNSDMPLQLVPTTPNDHCSGKQGPGKSEGLVSDLRPPEGSLSVI